MKAAVTTSTTSTASSATMPPLLLDLFNRSDAALDAAAGSGAADASLSVLHPFEKSLSSLGENVPLEVVFARGGAASAATEKAVRDAPPATRSNPRQKKRRSLTQLHAFTDDELDMEELRRMGESDPSLGELTRGLGLGGSGGSFGGEAPPPPQQQQRQRERRQQQPTSFRSQGRRSTAANDVTDSPTATRSNPRQKKRRSLTQLHAFTDDELNLEESDPSLGELTEDLGLGGSGSSFGGEVPPQQQERQREQHQQQPTSFRSQRRRSTATNDATGDSTADRPLTKCSSRERLQKLMAAPIIDWEAVRRVQKSHSQHAEQHQQRQLSDGENASIAAAAAAFPIATMSVPATKAAPVRRASFVRRRGSAGGRPGMYSKSSMMRASLQRLDRALGDGIEALEGTRHATRGNAETAAATRQAAANGSCWAGGLGIGRCQTEINVAARNAVGSDSGRRGKPARNASWSNKSADGAQDEAAAKKEPLAHDNFAWDKCGRFSPEGPASPPLAAAVSSGSAVNNPSPQGPAFLVARHGVAGSLAKSLASSAGSSADKNTNHGMSIAAPSHNFLHSHATAITSRSPSPPVFPGQLASDGGGDAATLFKTLIGASSTPRAAGSMQPPAPRRQAEGFALTKSGCNPASNNNRTTGLGALSRPTIARASSSRLVLSKRPSSKGLALLRSTSCSRGLALSKKPSSTGLALSGSTSSSRGLALSKRPSSKGLALAPRGSR